MEELGVNDFEDLPENLQALMVMIDEAGELLSPTGAKALSEFTVIPLANGESKLLKDVQVGDVLLDNGSQPTTVTAKYEPAIQTQYNVKVSSDISGKQESFIAGEEHYWVVYIANLDNSVDGPFLMETKELHEVMEEEKAKPAGERRKLKFKKSGKSVT